MLSPGAPATSAEPSRLTRNATPLVTPWRALSTIRPAGRSDTTAPAEIDGARRGASIRSGCRMSSVGATSSTGLGPCFSAALDAGFDMGSDMGLGAGLGMFISDGSSGAMIGPRARCGLVSSGSRTAWLPRAAGASPPGASAWKPNGPSHASSTRPTLPFFRRFGLAWRGRCPGARWPSGGVRRGCCRLGSG